MSRGVNKRDPWMDPRLLKGRSIISASDLSPRELEYLIETALDMKKRFYLGERVLPLLKGKTLILLFQKPSTRTRISFEVAMHQLGGNALTLNWSELQLARGEKLEHTAKVMSRYADGIMARVYSQENLRILAENADIPVINGLSDEEHPVQVFSDLMTIKEVFGRLKGITIAFLGDGRDNVLNSMLLAAPGLGVNIKIASPQELWPLEEYVSKAKKAAGQAGADITITDDPIEAVEGADVVYTDVWVSMGKEKEAEKRRRILKPYQVTLDLMRQAKSNAVFMHCLPAHVGEEVTEEVIESKYSIIWQQAENRLHLQKALLSLIMT
jgi:ornithine carbamoyltransferase